MNTSVEGHVDISRRQRSRDNMSNRYIRPNFAVSEKPSKPSSSRSLVLKALAHACAMRTHQEVFDLIGLE